MQVIDLERVQGASSEVIRDINRRIVLNLIRTRQPISRADLARVSGLQRSTISLIVEQLIEERWVLEGPAGRLPRGRRPTFLRLNAERVIIGVDIRPTQISVALADVNGKFTSQDVMPTPSDPKIAMNGIVERIQRIIRSSKEKKIEGIGISVPGRIAHESERLVFAPNLHWPETDLRTPISNATGLEVELENAANACVLAAVWFDRMEGVPQPGGGDSLRRDWHGHLCQRTTGARVERDGRGIRPRAARPVGSGLRLRQPRMLGGVRFQPRRHPLFSWNPVRMPTT